MIFDNWLQIQMMTATGLQRGTELILDLRLGLEPMTILTTHKAHQVGLRGVTPERMFP